MARLANGLLVSVSSGTHTIGPFSVPNNVTRALLRLARCTSADPLTWPNESTEISVRCLLSQDAGVTWDMVAGFQSGGGVVFGRDGSEAAESRLEVDLVAGQ